MFSSLAERLLLALSRDPATPDYPGGTVNTTADNALDLLLKTVPDFLALTAGKSVLDFGCGHGLQAAALARRSPSARVVGIDLPRPYITSRWPDYADVPNLTLTTDPLPPGERFDVVLSFRSFEHYPDPAAVLAEMRERVTPGGVVIISFAELWYSHSGSHMDGFTRVPWVNLLFPERVVMRVRSRYRPDGARRYEEVEGGLNRMSVRRFERLMRSSGMEIVALRLIPAKGLPLVTRVPVLRELLTSAASCVLRRPME